MSEAEGDVGHEEVLAALRTRADELERQLHEAETRSLIQLRQAELKAEAVRAGIVDIDGLRLLDPDAWSPPKGAVTSDAGEVIAKLRRDKPWLFGGSHSSSATTPPAAAPVRRRLATDMSIEEWRTARADLLRRC
jgi:hypothetical protein